MIININGVENSEESLFDKVKSIDSLSLFKQYCKNFKAIGIKFKSEFRDDKIPSCDISKINGNLLYTDFGAGLSIRAIDYVMLKYNTNFKDTLQIISRDFNLIDYGSKQYRLPIKNDSNNSLNNSNTNGGIRDKIPASIKIKKRVNESGIPIYRQTDLDYWNPFYWTEDMLRLSKTFAISHYFVNSEKTNYEDRCYMVNDERVYSYDYYEHNGIFRRKIYFPDRKTNKWLSNVDSSIVQLVDVMPKTGDVLFITSSKKDAGIFWRMHLDKMFSGLIIHGVAPNNEGSFLPLAWWEKAKTRWKRIILWHNNDWSKADNPGVTNAKKFHDKFGIEYHYNPDGEPKDPSDFSKKYGIIEMKKLIDRIL